MSDNKNVDFETFKEIILVINDRPDNTNILTIGLMLLRYNVSLVFVLFCYLLTRSGYSGSNF